METGNNIKRIAKIFYVFMVVVSILTGLIGTIIAIKEFSQEFGPIILCILCGAVVIALGIFFAWIIKTFIFGFGELVENSAAIRKNTEKKLSADTVKKTPEPPAAVMKTRQPETTSKPKAEAVCPIPAGHGRVRCPKCGEEQRANRNVCQKCGAAFLHE